MRSVISPRVPRPTRRSPDSDTFSKRRACFSKKHDASSPLPFPPSPTLVRRSPARRVRRARPAVPRRDPTKSGARAARSARGWARARPITEGSRRSLLKSDSLFAQINGALVWKKKCRLQVRSLQYRCTQKKRKIKIGAESRKKKIRAWSRGRLECHVSSLAFASVRVKSESREPSRHSTRRRARCDDS